jgi:hypothetical protein
MVIPDIFKYFSLISTPLFALIALFIIKQLPDFSLKKHTISKSIYFIKHKNQLTIFKLNFFLKMILDQCFSLYLINYFKLSIASPLFWPLILPPILFGLLSYFVMGSYTLIHRILVFSFGILFGISAVLLAYKIGNLYFYFTTILIVLVSNFLILEFFAKRKINVIVQIVSMSLMYGWLLIYVFKYL